MSLVALKLKSEIFSAGSIYYLFSFLGCLVVSFWLGDVVGVSLASGDVSLVLLKQGTENRQKTHRGEYRVHPGLNKAFIRAQKLRQY